jgi:meiosis arrest female protein 1
LAYDGQQKMRFNPYHGRQIQNNASFGSSGPLNSTFMSTSDFENSSSLLNYSTSTVASEQEASNVTDGVILQISNLDPWYDESSLRNYLLSQLKPITPVLSLVIESPSLAKVKVPSQQVSYNFWNFVKMCF